MSLRLLLACLLASLLNNLKCIAIAGDPIQPNRISAVQNVFHNEQYYQNSDSCKGLLPSIDCWCMPEVYDDTSGPNTTKVDTVSCTNADFDAPSWLASTFQTFKNLQTATFGGNRFHDLPERLSGPGQQKRMLYLNLTGNRIHRLHYDSLIGFPSLTSLDLSHNSIHLQHNRTDALFLRPVRFLKRLLLRHAFKRVEKQNDQLSLLESGLRHAHLAELQFLDLSHNGFGNFPHKLLCWLPELSHLVLAHNHFMTLRFDDRCVYSQLKVLDLRSNYFKTFSYTFTKTANHLPPMSISLSQNPLDCSSKSCASFHSMEWFRSTMVIKDKERVMCDASGHGDENGLMDDYMLYAPLNSQLNCPPFAVGTSSSTKYKTEHTNRPQDLWDHQQEDTGRSDENRSAIGKNATQDASNGGGGRSRLSAVEGIKWALAGGTYALLMTFVRSLTFLWLIR